jgi:chemotaxis protein methyltransferase CheR
MKDSGCVEFLKWALPHLGLRWPGYRRVRRQVCRRIGARVAALGLANFAAYGAYLQDHAEEWPLVDAACFIPISRFFRDRDVFDRLGSEVLPDLARSCAARGEKEIHCWSVGCASGEEPYSIKILWTFDVGRRFPDLALRILATDADQHMLARARRGCYRLSSLKEMPPDWRQRAFVREGDLYCISPALLGGIEFHLDDVRTASPERRFDLILCRNLAFTYFAEPLQRRVLARLVGHLEPGGALVIGIRETLPETVRGLAPYGQGAIFRRVVDRRTGAIENAPAAKGEAEKLCRRR